MWFMKVTSETRINESYSCHSSKRVIRDKSYLKSVLISVNQCLKKTYIRHRFTPITQIFVTLRLESANTTVANVSGGI